MGGVVAHSPPNRPSSRANEFHLSSQQDLAEMIAAGQSSLAGGSHLATMGISILDTYNPERCAAVGAPHKSNGTWVCPTLVISRAMALAGDPSLSIDPNIRYLPRSVRVSWEPQNNYLFQIAGVNLAYTKRQFQDDMVTVSALKQASPSSLARIRRVHSSLPASVLQTNWNFMSRPASLPRRPSAPPPTIPRSSLAAEKTSA
jgi:hypothetical protein